MTVRAKSGPGRLSDKVRQAATERRRSTLYLHLAANFEDFTAAIAAAGRPNWQAIAKAFAGEGLKDRLGHAPTAEGARQTWVAVRAAVAKDPDLPAKLRLGDEPEAPAPILPLSSRRPAQAPAPPPPTTAEGRSSSPPARHSFAVARFRTPPDKEDS